MKNLRPIIDIDMDHCAVDFAKGTSEWRKRHLDEQFPHSHLDFWINLDPMFGFMEAYEKLKDHYDIKFLTAPSIRNNACWTGKAMWVQKHFGESFLKELTITSYKGRLSGAALVDDGNEHGQPDYGGEHIHYGHDERFTNWSDITLHLLQKANERKE